jgi:3-hydroxypropanoate dehydrogenase
MSGKLGSDALAQLFTQARSQNKWRDTPVTDAQLAEIVDLMKMGPTSANCLPARFIFVRTAEAKARLKPFLSANNAEKTMAAPVCAIIGYDLKFAEHLPRLFPHNQDAKSWFANEQMAFTTAFRNGSLQGAYFIMAARAVGLDCGPMSGFDNAGVDKEFFPGGTVKSNFLCNIGHGDPAGLFARSPRFAFDEIAKII